MSKNTLAPKSRASWSYLVVPVVLLAVFLVFYSSAKRKWDTEAAAKAETERAEKQKNDAKKSEVEEAARVAAKDRADKQKREETQKEQDRIERWNKETATIESVTAKATAEADASNKESAALELEADTLRKRKEKVNREDFELLKQVQLDQAREQNAKLDIARLLVMVGDRAVVESQTPGKPPATP